MGRDAPLWDGTPLQGRGTCAWTCSGYQSSDQNFWGSILLVLPHGIMLTSTAEQRSATPAAETGSWHRHTPSPAWHPPGSCPRTQPHLAARPSRCHQTPAGRQGIDLGACMGSNDNAPCVLTCAVLMKTAKSAPFFMRLALQMWCLATPARKVNACGAASSILACRSSNRS